jgi:hypothetical protein
MRRTGEACKEAPMDFSTTSRAFRLSKQHGDAAILRERTLRAYPDFDSPGLSSFLPWGATQDEQGPRLTVQETMSLLTVGSGQTFIQGSRCYTVSQAPDLACATLGLKFIGAAV